jgi:hypothetical protein
MTFNETVLAQGLASPTNTLRWEDYTTTAMDPSDDCTFWYDGDYIKAAGQGYSTRIGGFRLPGCSTNTKRYGSRKNGLPNIVYPVIADPSAEALI